MKDKVIVITGSTSGIGFGMAQHFARLGGKIVLSGFISDKSPEQLSSELTKLGATEVIYRTADFAKPQEIIKMFEGILAKFGKVDILINNAGVQFVSPIEQFPADKWEAIIRIDLIAAFYTIKSVIPVMKKNGWGRIINIASAHALVASPFKSAYVAAKHGLLGLTKTVALEVAEYGITVNAICPGYVKTPLVLNQIADTSKARGITEEQVVKNVLLSAQATKKFVEIDEIAELAGFLCSDKAGSITGAGLSIDGGWTAQ